MLSSRRRTLMRLVTSAAFASCVLSGCHDDTPPSETAAATPPAAVLPVVPVKTPVPAKKTRKPTAAKNYLRTDAAGIVIVK